jgi:Transposase DDE domain group 1
VLREADRAIALIERVSACFSDHRAVTLIGQRIGAIALGYEDVNDHDVLRRDPVLALRRPIRREGIALLTSVLKRGAA